MRVKLSEVAAALAVSDISRSYVDILNGKVILLPPESDDEKHLAALEALEDDWERYLPIPDVRDAEEKSAMIAFAAAKDEELAKILKGAGGVVRFRRAVKQKGKSAEWEKFLHEHFIDTARIWCEDNEIACK